MVVGNRYSKIADVDAEKQMVESMKYLSNKGQFSFSDEMIISKDGTTRLIKLSGSNPEPSPGRNRQATASYHARGVAELADARASGARGESPCGFVSRCPDQQMARPRGAFHGHPPRGWVATTRPKQTGGTCACQTSSNRSRARSNSIRPSRYASSPFRTAAHLKMAAS